MRSSQRGSVFLVLLILGLLIAVFVGFLVYLQNNFEEVNQSSTVYSDISTDGWKTYQNDEVNFSIKYPTNWSLKVSNYNYGLKIAHLEGDSGRVDLMWGGSFGGVCDKYEKIKIRDESLLSCHFVKNGIESWEQINKNTRSGQFSAKAYANTFADRQLILNMIGTLKFF